MADCRALQRDAAAEQLLSCYEKAHTAFPRDIRPLMIHAQLLRPDQVPRLRLWEWLPLSLWPMCTTGGTCTFKTSAGSGPRTSARKTAQEAGVVFDFHQDTPVILPNMLETCGCAVCRRTKAGTLLGEGRGCPLGGAAGHNRQRRLGLFEEGEKGTLSPASGRTWSFWTGTPSPARRKS